MKSRIVETKEEKKFEPFTLEITVESEEDLCDLWHRFNIGRSTFNRSEYCSKNDLKHKISPTIPDLWEVLDSKVEESNLKKSK